MGRNYPSISFWFLQKAFMGTTWEVVRIRMDPTEENDGRQGS